MLNDIEVRKITLDNYDDFYQIRLEALKQAPEAFGMSLEEAKEIGKEEYRKRIPINKNGAVFVSYDRNQKPCGAVVVHQEKGIKREHRAFICSVFVSQSLRSNGVGELLMKAAIEFAQNDPKIERLMLSVNSENESAKKLYSKMGFIECGLEEKALKLNQLYFDEILMTLNLAGA